ncbi:hypothetical protein AYI68_g5271 [Smittium mucronatum]|uniref:Uncharacterized protein n=1 Tax=Smittium mucronatum TaxID=133383 RepID=A0A1R0GUS1_9FUNG|nr:hypothetical protein AYI68_g5271 [Smittium mucronatum]
MKEAAKEVHFGSNLSPTHNQHQRHNNTHRRDVEGRHHFPPRTKSKRMVEIPVSDDPFLLFPTMTTLTSPVTSSAASNTATTKIAHSLSSSSSSSSSSATTNTTTTFTSKDGNQFRIDQFMCHTNPDHHNYHNHHSHDPNHNHNLPHYQPELESESEHLIMPRLDPQTLTNNFIAMPEFGSFGGSFDALGSIGRGSLATIQMVYECETRK